MVTLKILDVSFRYNSVSALENVTFNVDEGEVVSLLGPNGSGKTTLLRCMCRLLKPQYGAILLDEEDLSILKRSELAKLIGYVPQLEETKFPMTVFEMILLGRKPYIRLGPGRNDIIVVGKVMKELGIEDLAFRKVSELSGGEWRKAVIARALAQEPKILLLDEPTNHLDLKHQVEVLKLIRRLALERNVCIVMAMHDINLAVRFSDKVVMLNQGKIVFCGKPLALKPSIIEKVYDVKVDVLHDRKGLPIITVVE